MGGTRGVGVASRIASTFHIVGGVLPGNYVHDMATYGAAPQGVAIAQLLDSIALARFTLHAAVRRAFGTTISLLLHLAHLHGYGHQLFDQSHQDSPMRFRAALLSPVP